jgi:hypothetical protein
MHKRNKEMTPKSEMQTPDSLYKALDDRFGFVRDVAAMAENTKCDIFMSAGGVKGTVVKRPDGSIVVCSGDALVDPWDREGSNFCNPPYGKGLDKWLSKALNEAENGATVVVLLPVDFSTRWWDIMMKASEWIRIRSRVEFLDANGKPLKGGPMFSSVVGVFWGCVQPEKRHPMVTEMDWKPKEEKNV